MHANCLTRIRAGDFQEVWLPLYGDWSKRMVCSLTSLAKRAGQRLMTAQAYPGCRYNVATCSYDPNTTPDTDIDTDTDTQT